MTCAHEHFAAEVKVNRLEGGPQMQFMADVRVRCTQCGLPFEFLGLEPGLDLQGAKVSIDGQEARLAITPQGVRPNPLQRLAFGVSKYDG